jgi:type IV pilus assembly protein PilX
MMKNLLHTNQTIKPKQRGVALVVSLIILVLMTIVGLSILNGNRYLEKNAGASRDKQRAIQAAQDALLYAEWWLVYGGGNLDFKTCGTSAPTTIQVCTYDPAASTANLANVAYYTKYTPNFMTVQTTTPTAGGLAGTAATSDIIYSQNPGIYVNCISCGNTLGTTGLTLYRITAIGYGGIGGNNGTTAIVQSVYASAGPVVPPSKCTGGPGCY